MTKPQPTQIKKVSPYPIAAQFQGVAPFPGELLRLTTRGCLVDLKGGIVKVHDEFKVVFTLPVLKNTIESHCKVVRFVDRVVKVEVKEKKTAIERLAEFHFINLKSEHVEAIKNFCLAIRQEES